HRHRLDLVVRDIDGCDPETASQGRDLGASLDPQLRVEVRQRFVHEEDLRGPDDGPAHGYALSLPAGQRLRLPVEEGFEVEKLRGLVHSLIALLASDAGDLERERHVLPHGHMRIERIVLEHHGDITFARGQQSDIVLADADVAGVDGFETCEHAQGGGLPASGGTDEDEELAIGDVETDLVDGGGQRLRVMTERIVEGDCGHDVLNLSRMRTHPMIAGDRAVSSGRWTVSVRVQWIW